MADNVNVPSIAGIPIATDDVGGIQYQRAKVSWGVDGVAVDASATNPLPVNPVPSSPLAAQYLPVRLTDGSSFYTASGGGGGGDASAAKQDAQTALLTTIATTGIPITGTVTVGSHAVTNAGTFAVQAAQSGTWNINAITTLPALPAGTNNIGDVDVLTLPSIPTGANTIGAVNIAAAQTLATVTTVGTVSSVSAIIPGVGATNLGKAEDAVHADGDTGVMALAVRRDADTTLAGTTGDYAPLQVNAAGSLKVAITSGAGSGGTSAADGSTYTRATTSLTPAGAVVETSAPTLTNGQVAGLSQTTGGALRVSVAGGGVAGVVEDAASAGGEEGILTMAIRQDTLASSTSADGDFANLKVNASGALYVAGSFSAVNGVVSTANSSTANLAGAAAFTGTSEETTAYAAIMVYAYASHVSATNGLSLQQSHDGTNWFATDTYTVAATTPLLIHVPAQARYFRLVYTNGATLTTTLFLQTIFKTSAPRGSSQRPADAISNENDFEQVMSFSMGYNGATWDRLRSTTANGLAVDVTRLSALVAGAATIGSIASITTSIVPGVAATNLGKAEDAAHASGDTGVMVLGVRQDSLTTLSSATGDYDAIKTDALGRVYVNSQVNATASVLGATTPFKLISAASTNATSLKGTAGVLYMLTLTNKNAATRSFKLYNKATAPTVGTDVPVLTYEIPGNTAGAGIIVPIPAAGVGFATGIAYATTTENTDAGTTAVAAGDIVVNGSYL